MKLIKQISLHYQEGTSDKVYEIDLYQVGEEYVVNFRYGRRGTILKEGTKTIFPVSLTEAEKVFNNLEQEKRKKGYVSTGDESFPGFVTPTNTDTLSPIKNTVLKYLKSAVAGDEPENWPVSRVIWRAGELKITEAVPYILQLADYSNFFNIYSIVWSIGRLGVESGLPFLKDLLNKEKTPEHILKLAEEATLELSPQDEKEIKLKSLIESLPDCFKGPIQQQDVKNLEVQVRDFLFNLKTSANEYISSLYKLSRHNNLVRQVFLKTLPDIPFEKNYFKFIRHIFKTAEMLEDYEVYGIISKEIEKKTANFTASYSYNEKNQNKVFSPQTKEYLIKRILRLLSRAGNAGEDAYTKLAGGILLAFDDTKDLTEPFEKRRYEFHYDQQTRSYTQEVIVTGYDVYAIYRAFNYILYTHSPRYVISENAWKCVPPFSPGNPAPEQREEAFPQLWDKDPGSIIQLLKSAKAERVHEFALKVFKANPAFENHLKTDDLVNLLNTSYTETLRLAFQIAKKRFKPQEPDKVLLIALLQCDLKEAREQAYEWVSIEKINLLGDTVFVSDLIKINNPDTHLWLRSFFVSAYFRRDDAEIIIGRLISWLLNADYYPEKGSYFNLIADTLVIAFQDNLKYINLEVIKDLLQHEAEELHELAGKILLKHDIRPESLPEELLLNLLNSGHIQTRTIGLQLLAKFPEHLLLGKKEMLVSFCISPLQDLRSAVKPIISKLNVAYPSFGKELVDLFVPAFLMKESYEGLHEDLLHLLTEELKENLRIIEKNRVLRLLNSKFRAAQRLGAFLLKEHIKEEELTIPEIVKLAENPLEEVRKYSWNFFSQNLEKAKSAKADSIRITDSEWEDTRLFAFDYFRTKFNTEDWLTDLLVSICDSNKEDVQRFGWAMITMNFEKEHGKEYLLKLSQHPNTRIQLFTTTYLESYAKDKPETIESLILYFITVLSQINKGKAAKERVLAFLKREAVKSEQAARICTEIFTRVSLSVAIKEKAVCIEALKEIKKAYPQIDSPLLLKDYPEYIRK